MLVRPLAEADLDEADRIYRLAFGTFLGERHPARFGGDTDTIRGRWKADPAAAFAADLRGRLAGSNFAVNWGTVGFFGPLTVTPKHWDQGVGQRLLDATMDLFAAWGTQHTGLFTFAHSAKHVGLYQKFGFWPRFLTAIMSRPVPPGAPGRADHAGRPAPGGPARRPAGHRGPDRCGVPRPRREPGGRPCWPSGWGTSCWLTARPAGGGRGLRQRRGDRGGGRGVLRQVRRGAAGARAAEGFGLLLDACGRLAAGHGASAAVGRERRMRPGRAAIARHGFRAAMQGVAMHRPNQDGYHVSDRYVIDDWR